MRKGTHSCFECRRRKIRCIFNADNPNVCTECFARGSRCVDQEHAENDVIVDHRKNLRERVARLESILDTMLEEKSETKAVEVLRSMGSVSSRVPPTPSSQGSPLNAEVGGVSSTEVGLEHTNAPVMMLFDNAVLARPQGQQQGQPLNMGNTVVNLDGSANKSSTYEYITRDVSNSQANSKANQTRQALLSTLPSYKELMETLRANEQWWTLLGRKCQGTRGGETIEQFTNRVLARGTPCELGSLVICYGICSEGDIIDKCLYMIDRYIISDDEYMGTLEGLECSILQSKVYADIGSARRSWLTFRRAIGFAQLMGLHRNRAGSPERDSIWWSLYEGDKLISLMLGMPHAISDRHCNLEVNGQSIDNVHNAKTFVAKVAQFAGKVIDRNQAIQESTFSSAMDLDQEMDHYAAKMPADFWAIEPYMTAPDTVAAVEWQEKILTILCYHQTKVYLHMPFMLKSTANSGFEYSRDACFNGAREMLRLYHILRAPGNPTYACKAIDFIGFTASVLVVLGLLGYGRGGVENPEQDERDWQLIDTSITILKHASTERGGKVAEQSYQALELLAQIRNFGDMEGPDPEDCECKIAIPFFGTISVQRGKSFKHHGTASSSSGKTPASCSKAASCTSGTAPTTPSLDANTLSHVSTAASTAPPSHDNPFIAYDGFYMPPTPFDGAAVQSAAAAGAATVGNGGVAGAAGGATDAMAANWPVASGFLWENVGNMDIDQDWSWFMNDLGLQQQQQQQQQGGGNVVAGVGDKQAPVFGQTYLAP